MATQQTLVQTQVSNNSYPVVIPSPKFTIGQYVTLNPDRYPGVDTTLYRGQIYSVTWNDMGRTNNKWFDSCGDVYNNYDYLVVWETHDSPWLESPHWDCFEHCDYQLLPID